ncbi:MAG: biosynthetic arginine decarboxylase [Myxococcota bacterium]
MRAWTIQDSIELYQVPQWGRGFFGIDENGDLRVQPHGPDGPAVSLPSLVEDLRQRGLRTPLLLRFSDILAERVSRLAGAFSGAANEYGYKGRFRGVYPIKVNQQRPVVEEIVSLGADFGIGLEAGSKPELLIALALLDTKDALIVCNGYKDRAYIETALLGQRLGRRPVIVIDRFHEIDLVIKAASELGIRPHLGVRARLSSRGAGKWVDSTGDKSKFGLSAAEIVETVERLRSEDMLDCLELLHFHIGSQITTIRAIKDALREATRIFAELFALGATPGILDVGGGLGVDYDGSQTNFHSSKNYSVQEYANDVVSSIQEACDAADVPHPDIVTEAGRWMVAHHSLMVFDVLGVNEIRSGRRKVEPVSDDDPKVLRDLAEVWETVNKKNVTECYHDALQLKEDAATLFNVGQLDLPARARVERLFWSCCEKIQRVATELREVPEELHELERGLADTYYTNLSVFQSIPDAWAVKQLFPIMPIHRLNEKPTRRGILADLTCDSDGKIDQFIDQHDVKNVLELHGSNGRPYYLAAFLIGAYQEILGDLHNLFGDTDAVHVSFDPDGGYSVENVMEGENVKDVLAYVEYDSNALKEKVRRLAEHALRRGDITLEEATRLRRRYDQGLWEYTYLDSRN